ncbi:hypothetical protein AMS68_002107 [Peltaster fructicola]|uniref:Major facilitator superfamily (MFS) profile domain-containing protein n=1 Tax=Peltaster fructicola TaxID=286661 RepID=A0A6H0XQ36_9PEZI|nr:hypothetical protein AMS68_002107 [Peltaster fructicola]
MYLNIAYVQCVAVSLVWASLGYDVSLIVGLLSNDQWLAFNPNESLLGLVIAAFVIGATVIAIPSAYISDYIGRRESIRFGSIFSCVFIVLQTCSVDWRMFLAMRLLGGCATAVSLINSSPYLTESCNRHRAILTALSPTFFYIGSTPGAWTAFGTLPIQSSWSWRLVVMFQLPWSLLQLVLISWCPESPQWLYRQGKIEEAAAVLRGILGDNEADQVLQGFGQSREHGSWRHLIYDHRRLFLIVLFGLGTPWLGSGIIGSYLGPFLATLGIANHRRQIALNGGLQVMQLVVSVICAFQVDKVGRRRLLVFSAISMLLCMTALTTCAGVHAHGMSNTASMIAVVAIFLFLCSYNAGFTTVPGVYIAELMPAELRMKAGGLSALLSGIAMSMNQWLNPIALNALGWQYLFVFDACLVGMIVALFFVAPETKGMSLAEAEKVCDGYWLEIRPRRTSTS